MEGHNSQRIHGNAEELELSTKSQRTITNCCIICYKLCPSGNGGSGNSGYNGNALHEEASAFRSKEKVMKRFFNLMERHLNQTQMKTCSLLADLEEGGNGKFNLEEALKAGISVCGDCLMIMESFCDLYHQMKSIELLLDWKVWTVRNIMSQAKKVRSRVQNLKDVAAQAEHCAGGGALVCLILDFKERLIKQSSQRLLTSFPKIAITKSPIAQIAKYQDSIITLDPVNPVLVHADSVDDNFDDFSNEEGESGKDAGKSSDFQHDYNRDILKIAEIQSDEMNTVVVQAHVVITDPYLPIVNTEEEGIRRSSETQLNDSKDDAGIIRTPNKIHYDYLIAEGSTENTVTQATTVEGSKALSAKLTTEEEIGCLDLFDSTSRLSPKEGKNMDDIEASTQKKNETFQMSMEAQSTNQVNAVPDGVEDVTANTVKTEEERNESNSIILEDTVPCVSISLHGDEPCIPGEHLEIDTISSLSEKPIISQFAPTASASGSVRKQNPESRCKNVDLLVEKITTKDSTANSCQQNSETGNIKRTAIQPSRRSLRDIYRCNNCFRTFATGPPLAQHHKTESCHAISDHDSEDNDNDNDNESEAETTTTGTSDTDTDDLPEETLENSAGSPLFDTHTSSEDGKVRENAQKLDICHPQVEDSASGSAVFATVTNDSDIKVKRKPWPCPDCHRSYGQKLTLNSHLILYHSPEWKKMWKKNTPFPKKFHYRFKCPGCNKLFKELHSVLLHRKQTHPSNNTNVTQPEDNSATIKVQILSFAKKPGFTCNGNPNEFVVFANIDSPEHVYMCDVANCAEPFYSPDELERHSKLHGEFKCNFCNSVMDYAPRLSEHELEHCKIKKTAKKGNSRCYKWKQCICPRCEVPFPSKGNYVDHHVKAHMSLAVNSNACAICKMYTFGVTASCQSWVTKYAEKTLLLHYKLYHDKGADNSNVIRICHVKDCGAYFLTQAQLICHLKLRHNAMEDDSRLKAVRRAKFQCRDCDKNFSGKNGLIAHRLRYHVNKKDVIPCSYKDCRSKFETKEELKSHTKWVHQLPQNFRRCPKCNKCFYKMMGFKNHLKSHKRTEDIEAGILDPKQKQDAHVCELCGKCFRLKAALEIHSFTHSGPESWKFTCGVCSKKCLSKFTLAGHMRTHTKEKPFVCEVCGGKYAHRHNLRNHVNSKHGDVVQDIPKKLVRPNFTSRKGIKLNRKKDMEESMDVERGGD